MSGRERLRGGLERLPCRCPARAPPRRLFSGRDMANLPNLPNRANSANLPNRAGKANKEGRSCARAAAWHGVLLNVIATRGSAGGKSFDAARAAAWRARLPIAPDHREPADGGGRAAAAFGDGDYPPCGQARAAGSCPPLRVFPGKAPAGRRCPMPSFVRPGCPEARRSLSGFAVTKGADPCQAWLSPSAPLPVRPGCSASSRALRHGLPQPPRIFIAVRKLSGRCP